MRIKRSMLHIAIASALFGTAAHADFGADMDAKMATDSYDLFGVNAPLAASASTDTPRAAGQTGADLVDLAGGLTATILTRTAAHHTDMFAFWPHGSANPTHLISCVEGGDEFLTDAGNDGVFQAGDVMNPSVQALDLTDGSVTTLVRGMSRCDGIRATAWGTILATEEETDGGAYELLVPADPTTFTEVTVTDRAAATIVVTSTAADASATAVKRSTLATMAWEGLEVLDTGVVIGGDELRPGTGTADNDGGAIFKFVPTTLRTGTATISDLTTSPLAAGSNYAMRVSCTTGTQYGQGCEIGNAAWVAVGAASARADANTAGATGYYRPEDLHLDPTFTGTGIRFCWANTGNEGADNFAEVVCAVDSAPSSVTGNNVSVNRFVEGDAEFNSMDNLAFQPVSGALAVIEDHTNGDVWMCLPDGADRDIKTDGCIRILSVKDQSAEPTGFMFSPDGTKAYVSIQHSDDASDGSMDDADGYGTDDVLVITGFALPESE
jgi:secreted PhoX family phosphatase